MKKIKHVKTDIHSLVKKGNISKIKSLLKKQPDLVNAIDDDGRTPLWFAPNVGVMELLIANGADIASQDYDGFTMLNQYVAKKDITMIKLLLSSGADVNQKDDADGWTPLMSTFPAGVHAAEFLIAAGADVDAQNDYEETALHLASSRGRLDFVELLLSHGADIHAVDIAGFTPLFEACKASPEVVKVLVERGARVNDRNEDGLTPLQVATKFGHERSVDILLTNEADFTLGDVDGNTPAHWAVLRGIPEIDSLLRQRGADFERKNKAGLTPNDMMQVVALHSEIHCQDDVCYYCENDCSMCRL